MGKDNQENSFLKPIMDWFIIDSSYVRRGRGVEDIAPTDGLYWQWKRNKTNKLLLTDSWKRLDFNSFRITTFFASTHHFTAVAAGNSFFRQKGALCCTGAAEFTIFNKQ